MTPAARDALEHLIRCQCGCTLDVFTCRTTDFTCQVSPAMHRDVMSLIAGGYDEREILAAFVDVYGESVLMAPPRRGFNLVGYVLPGAGIALGGVLLLVLLRSLRRQPAAGGTAPVTGVDATPEELARLDAALRDDDA
jgi:cytochrome c-type biogenesis protein CcmH